MMGNHRVPLGREKQSCPLQSPEGLIRFKSKEGGVKTPIYRIERYPDGFDKSLLHKKNDYLSNISKKAIASGQISVIRETSNNYYGKFA